MIVIGIGAGSASEYPFCPLRARRMVSEVFLLFDCLSIVMVIDFGAGGAFHFPFYLALSAIANGCGTLLVSPQRAVWPLRRVRA